MLSCKPSENQKTWNITVRIGYILKYDFKNRLYSQVHDPYVYLLLPTNKQLKLDTNDDKCFIKRL